MKRLPTYLHQFFASPRQRHAFRPRLEQLENRVAPTVNLLNNFDGFATSGGTKNYAPDTCGAAGPNSYIETVNHAISIFNTFTNTSIASDTNLGHFLWTIGGIKNAGTNAALSDATVCYDEAIGRFVVGDLDVNYTDATHSTPTTPSQFDFAVSKTSNPTALDKKNWSFYSFTTSEGTLWSDYPGNLGYNADALVVTFNMIGSSPQHVQVNAIPQSSLAAGGGVQVSSFDINGWDWRPVTMHDATAGGPMWFVTDGGDNQSIDLERVDNILSAPTLHTFTFGAAQGLTKYGAVHNPLNPDGTTITTNTNGSKIMKAAERSSAIVACQTVGNGSTENDVRWYEFNVSYIDSPFIWQWGTVSAGNNTYLMMPGIDINPLGDIGMSYIRSGTDSSTDYMSVWITGGKTSGASGTMQTPVEVKAGDSNDSVNGREGDFSGIDVDPNDGTFWIANEYSKSGSAATEVANFALNANFTVNNSQLQINGDQSGANYNDYIAVDVAPSGSLYAVLNGEANIYGAGQITSIQINPGGGANTVRINNVPSICPTTVTGDGANYVTIGNSFDGVQGINSGVNVYNGYPTPSSTGHTNLTVDDSADTSGQSATLSDQPYGVGSYQVGSLVGLAPAPINWFDNSSGTYTGGVSFLAIYGGSGGNTFTVTNTGKLYSGTYLNSGQGTNTVNVEGTAGSLDVDGGSGVQDVYVGSKGSALGGTLANLHGSVNVHNSYNPYAANPKTGYSYLYVDDGGNQSSPNMNLNFDSLTSSDMPSSLQWVGYKVGVGGVIALYVYGPKGNYPFTPTYNVYSTGSGSTSYSTFLYTGTGGAAVNVYSTLGLLAIANQGGTDYVTVGSDGSNSDSTMASIKGAVDVGGVGASLLYLFDWADTTGRTVYMYDGEVTGLAPANIVWIDNSPGTNTGGVYYLEVHGGSGGNTFNVENTSPFNAYTFLGTGTGSDQVNVYATKGTLYDYNPGGYVGVIIGAGNIMSGINGIVHVYGPASINLALSDSSDTTGRTAYLYDGEVTGLSPAAIYYTPTSSVSGGVYYLQVGGGSGGNTFYVENTSNLYEYTLLSPGTGNDSVYVYNTQSPLAPLYIDNPKGSDSVDVGAGNMSSINGLVNISNTFGSGSTALLLDDSSDSTTRTVTMGPGSLNKGVYVTGMGNAAPVGYNVGVTSVTVDGGSGNNIWNVNKTLAGTATTINAGTGNNTFNVGSGGVGNLAGLLTVNGGGGNNTLEGPPASTAFHISGHNAGSLASAFAGVTFAGVQNLIGDSPPGPFNDGFIFADGASVDGNISDSGNSANTLDFSAYTTPVTVDLSAGTATGVGGSVSNIRTLIGGQSDDSLTGNAAGNTIFLAGPGNDTIIGAGGTNTLVGTNAASTWNITAQNSGTLTFAAGTTTFSGVQNLTGGSAADDFVFADGAGVDGNINGGGGSDTLDYSAYSTPVTVNLATATATGVGGVAFNVRNFVGSAAGGSTLIGPNADTTWNLSGTGTGSMFGGLVIFSNFSNLTGGSGNDTFTFANGAGIDGNLDGGGGSNTLNESAYTTAVAVDLAGLTASGVGGNIANVQTFAGGSGSNTLSGPNTATTWTLSGSNAGTLTGGFSFSAFASLTGGAGDNTFVFAAGATLSGTLTGGGGTNSLDYSAYTTSVIVDLQTNVATGVGSLAGTFVNVHGGNSSGAGLYNLLIGNGGNTLTGGTGRRNILVAGGSASTLIGGSGDDLLIGGSTSYDTESGLSNWQAIAAYWAGTDSFDTRVSNLESGTGVPLLDATIVTGNGGGNTLSSTFNELALLYTDGGDTIAGFNANSPQYPITP